MNIPKIKDHLRPVIIDEDKVIVCSEYGQQLLTGRSLVHVVRNLNDQNSVDNIINNLNGIVDPAQIWYVLSFLEDRNYITEYHDKLETSESAFWNLHGIDGIDVSKQKTNSRIKIYTVGSTDETFLKDELKALSFQIVNQHETFAAILTDDYLQDEVSVIANQLWKQNTPFIICKPNGLEMWLGPFFVPSVTACFECLKQRLIANRDVEVYLRETGKINAPLVARSSLRATIHAGMSLMVTEISKFLVMGHDASKPNTMHSLNYGTLESTKHVVVKRPQCKICGQNELFASDRLPKEIHFKSSPKNFTDGGHRSVTAFETYEKFKHHISPISGIVKKLERITNAEDPLQHVFISGQNMALKTKDFKSLKKNLRSNSCGKGVTEIQAKVSAIGEAIERYSGVYRGEEIVVRTTYNKLGDKAIHPNSIMQYSDSQYRDYLQWNSKESFFNVVPNPFDENAEIEWTPLWSISRQSIVYLPSAVCYYSHPENGGDKFFCTPDSNGNAAGNTLEEAVLQGFLELIERDSVAIWWYNRLKMPCLDISSFNDRYADDLKNYHKSRNRDLWVLDLTSDSGIPVFIAISARNDRLEYQDIVFAPAAHLDPSIALRRALTELNQMLPSMKDDAPPGTYNYDDPECIHWWTTCNVQNQPYLLPDEEQPLRTLQSFTTPKFDDLKNDLEYCVDIVKKLGLEMHILDQTRPDIGLNVVKVVVPGLRHFWARNAPGRLYSVPVKMGRRATPIAEEDLNPISMFI